MWLDELVYLLEAGGVGTFGTDLFATSRAVIPMNGDGPFTHLIATGGSGPSWIQNSAGPSQQHPGCQVMSVAKLSAVAETRSRQAYDVFAAVHNQTVGTARYRSIVPLQEPFDFQSDDIGRARWIFNILGDKSPSIGAAVSVIMTLIADLDGDAFGFQTPSGSDVYPSGTTFDKLVPGSYPVLLNANQLFSTGSYVLEANARVDTLGARVKVGLFNLATPNTPVVEIAFTTSELVGERKRSAAFTIPTSDTVYGVKLTTNSTLIGGAAWGCRILRV